MPPSLFRYILASSAWHQLALLLLTVTVFLVELVPLELQRRIVNDLVKDRSYRLIIALCAVYAGVVLAHGGTKLTLNIYRGWVAERATRDLRRRIEKLHEATATVPLPPDMPGIEVSMMVSEVEPIGGFVGESISEPVLQAGVMTSVLAYIIHLEPWMAASGMVLFLPQLLLVPLLQRAINRRTGARIRLLRVLSIDLLGTMSDAGARGSESPVDGVFRLDMGILKLKFGMNFLMNFCNHLQIIIALLVGGWFVLHEELEIGGVVAFISAIGRLNDPWGDLVNYFRDLSMTRVKFDLLLRAFHRLANAAEAADAGKIEDGVPIAHAATPARAGLT